MSDDFEDFVTTRWPRLVRVARLMGCDSYEAEDRAQEALIKIQRHWGRVSAARDIDAYVHQILLNQIRSAHRRAWRGEVPTEFDRRTPGCDDATDSVNISALISAALGRLTEDQRAVVVLRLYADLTERATADALNVPPGTVKSRLSRALNALSMDPNIKSLAEGW